MAERPKYEGPTVRARLSDVSGRRGSSNATRRDAVDTHRPSSIANDAHESEDGLERESEDPNEITRPFDPEKIRVRTVPILVDQIVSRIAHREIDLAPEFQRTSGIWDSRRQSRLIESLMLRIPIPVFYVAADQDEKWSVVDGVQRISTLNRFITGRFQLQNLEYLTSLEKKRFEELPRAIQRRINETQLVIHVIEPGTPEEVMFNIFRRINTGGLILNGQEIRHAMHPGPVRAFLKDLANFESFLNATTNSIESNRMSDRECVLRFLAFYIDPWENYSSSNIDGFLSEAMVKINKLESNTQDQIAREFDKAMSAAQIIFKENAFRKQNDLDSTRRRPISKALFETWSVALARCSDSEIEFLIEHRHQVRSGFVDLMNSDQEFADSISYATGTPKRVKKRFQAISNLVQESLKC